ncbi:MAG: TM2 domain-containing protein [Chloroflexi bacterium]|nr:TM2 domain-containing protein [Chloroflexota bacterium]
MPTKNKVAAGVLAIVLGWLGIHKFYLGYITAGILLIIITVVTCGIVGPIIGLIEGILYLTKTDEEFHDAYVVNSRSWF